MRSIWVKRLTVFSQLFIVFVLVFDISKTSLIYQVVAKDFSVR